MSASPAKRRAFACLRDRAASASVTEIRRLGRQEPARKQVATRLPAGLSERRLLCGYRIASEAASVVTLAAVSAVALLIVFQVGPWGAL